MVHSEALNVGGDSVNELARNIREQLIVEYCLVAHLTVTEDVRVLAASEARQATEPDLDDAFL